MKLIILQKRATNFTIFSLVMFAERTSVFEKLHLKFYSSYFGPDKVRESVMGILKISAFKMRYLGKVGSRHIRKFQMGFSETDYVNIEAAE